MTIHLAIFHEIKSPHLKLLNGGQICLRHVVRLVAAINVLVNDLGLLNDVLPPLLCILLIGTFLLLHVLSLFHGIILSNPLLSILSLMTI